MKHLAGPDGGALGEVRVEIQKRARRSRQVDWSAV